MKAEERWRLYRLMMVTVRTTDGQENVSDLFADFCLIICPKSFVQVILLRHLSFGHINEN